MIFWLLFGAVLLFTVGACLAGVALCRSLNRSEWLEVIGQ